MKLVTGKWYRDRQLGIRVVPVRPHFGASETEGRWTCRDEFDLTGNYLVEELEEETELQSTPQNA